MGEFKLLLPSMGEGVMEATITEWLVNEGDQVQEDDSLVEIATDKVDSEVPTPVSGKIIKILKAKNQIVQVGEVIVIIETDSPQGTPVIENPTEVAQPSPEPSTIATLESPLIEPTPKHEPINIGELVLSPLVKSIIKEENISESEIKTIIPTGLEGRITKEDILKFLSTRNKTITGSITSTTETFDKPLEINNPIPVNIVATPNPVPEKKSTDLQVGDEIIEMDRVRKIISDAMVNSKKISAHVTSFIETDVTNVVKWRNIQKNNYEKRERQKLTFMPIFVRAVVKAIQDYPLINISVDGTKIIKKKNINIGMATALPDGNLIVPVIKNADQLSLSGLAKAINDLAHRARNKQLKPDDTQGATYTISNVGSFGNLMGTPIISQPQVAILAVGAIIKKPKVIETSEGDVIGIRQMMFMSHSYDHRVVDGSLGGLFLKRVHDYLENWDIETEI